MKTYVPINIIVHHPKTEEGKRELAGRVAEVHADVAFQQIKSLNCPFSQKSKLLDAIIASNKVNHTIK